MLSATTTIDDDKHHHYEKVSPDETQPNPVDDTTTTPTNSKAALTKSLRSHPHLPPWRRLFLSLLLLLFTWLFSMLFLSPHLWSPTPVKRDGHNLVYWTPHKTGSTSMREWLLKVAHTLEADISITRKYPYKPHEDHHHRFARVGLSTCAFLAGHIRVPSLRDRTNELKLGAVITTIREPYALLMSKYFHRTRLKLNQATLKKYMNPTSQPSRRWFFYFNDLDPCEQLRYYDGLEGCTITNSPALQKRVHAIADRIDCVVDTDDPGHDLLSLCSQMQMSDHECPKLLVENVNNGHSLYDTMLTLPHIKSVMSRAVNVTVLLREAFLRRRCRFLENGSLTTPGAEPPQWPFKRCKHIDAMDLSGNGDGVTDDAPENDAHDDDDLKPQVISDEGGAYATDVQDDTGEEEKKESESEGDKKKEAGGVVGNEASS